HSYLALGELAVAPKMSLTEGNGKIANYMAMGLPTVAFETPVAREILADTGIYARHGSAEDLAAKLERLLDEPDLAARLGQAARERAVAELSWDRAAQQIEAIYAKVQAARTTKLVQ
ncbi:MAG: glycosyltransferase, partial [Chloroflexia bacterium]|nr:glycosyltransferase [Chloroflexia bacterium]